MLSALQQRGKVMVEQAPLGGRTHQKERTRSAIVAAAHDRAETGDDALAPSVDDDGPAREDVEQLVRDLAVVISAESIFSLTDLCGLSPDVAVAGLVHTARCVTTATVTAPRTQGLPSAVSAQPTSGDP